MGNPPITFLRQVLALGKNKSSPKNIIHGFDNTSSQICLIWRWGKQNPLSKKSKGGGGLGKLKFNG